MSKNIKISVTKYVNGPVLDVFVKKKFYSIVCDDILEAVVLLMYMKIKVE